MFHFTHSYRCSRALAALLVLAAGSLAACGGGGGGGEAGFERYAAAGDIVNDFAGSVVVPTYSELAERLAALSAAVQALEADRSQAGLDAAQAAWIAAREPWEASEGFLFGPVDSLGLDPALDSWPVDRNALDGVLGSAAELTVAYVATLETTLQGFHTAEYLLFGTDGDKTAAQLTDREMQYLSAVASLMAEAGSTLADSWTVGAGGSEPYAAIFTGAGGNSVYPSLGSAGEEIVRGMIGIADEVANGKIADPFDQRDPTLVESQFSHNSLTDFQNNVRSIQHAYTGDVAFAGTEGAGIDDYVTAMDPDLDARFSAELAAALEALGAIAEPFRDAITDPQAADEIIAAQEAIRAVKTTLEQDILPLFI